MAKAINSTLTVVSRVEPFQPARRGLFALLGGMGAVVRGAAAASPNSDAALLALCAEWMETDKVFEREDDVPDAEMAAIIARRDEIRSAIRVLPASTGEGRKAKAEMVIREMALNLKDEPSCPDDFAAWSLAQDVLRLDTGA